MESGFAVGNAKGKIMLIKTFNGSIRNHEEFYTAVMEFLSENGVCPKLALVSRDVAALIYGDNITDAVLQNTMHGVGRVLIGEKLHNFVVMFDEEAEQVAVSLLSLQDIQKLNRKYQDEKDITRGL